MSELLGVNEQTVNWQIICRESCILAERDKEERILISIK